MTFQDIKNLAAVWLVTGLACGTVTLLVFGLIRAVSRLVGAGG